MDLTTEVKLNVKLCEVDNIHHFWVNEEVFLFYFCIKPYKNYKCSSNFYFLENKKSEKEKYVSNTKFGLIFQGGFWS